jgi:hypothetical protein
MFTNAPDIATVGLVVQAAAMPTTCARRRVENSVRHLHTMEDARDSAYGHAGRVGVPSLTVMLSLP